MAFRRPTRPVWDPESRGVVSTGWQAARQLPRACGAPAVTVPESFRSAVGRAASRVKSQGSSTRRVSVVSRRALSGAASKGQTGLEAR